ncbi:Hypothetical predicted protein [Paramuricea clavata]|uniref:Uncharacterized protein n=1 Tax=Paramuricea clavata TaxID=317549 RepID=A0A6S7HUH4_PARCT|nr:Hypothetical predicted protein [Paramuricea clavata]
MTIVDDDNSEVDISTKYFSSQMFSFPNKGIISSISVRVAVAESPLVILLFLQAKNISIINTTPEYSPTSKQESPRIALPLERYAKKQAEVVQNYSDELKSNTKELKDFDFKLQKACDQNR